MWVKFWYELNCAEGADKEFIYIYYSKDYPDKDLLEEAREYVPGHYWDNEFRPPKYGFKRIKHLPADVCRKLYTKYKLKLNDAKYMIEILEQEIKFNKTKI
jgi:hypothetical protein